MSFDETIRCSVIGDMIDNETLTIYPERSVVSCYTCGCRLSVYNSSDRCFPCRKKEKQVITKSINEIFEVENV